jgi:hypothetical protein
MNSYLTMLPDEIYHMIYRPVFTDIINECVRRRLLDLKHRSLNHYHTLDSYDSLFKRCRINRSIVYAWLLGIKKTGNRIWTDGDKLYSYEMMIGYTHNYEKVVKLYTAQTGHYLSQTTSTHCNMASQFADATVSPSE